DITDVVFPTLTNPSPKTDDELLGGSPVKRFRYSEHYPTSLGSISPSQRKRLDRYSSVDALSLLHSPHVRRRTLSPSKQQPSDIPTFTPHSILKVRKMVRRSASPDNVSLPSYTSTATTPDLPVEEEQEPDDEQMQVSDDEVPTGRQIRFSFPMVQEQVKERSRTPDVVQTRSSLSRSAMKRSLLGGTPRKPLSRSSRSPVVTFGTSSEQNKITLNDLMFAIPVDAGDGESASAENDSEVFHSLENSFTDVESPMKKQRVDSSPTDVSTNMTHAAKVEEHFEKVSPHKGILPDTTHLDISFDDECYEDEKEETVNSQKMQNESNKVVAEPMVISSNETEVEEDKSAVDEIPERSGKVKSRKGILLDDTTYHKTSFGTSFKDDKPEEEIVNTHELQDERDNYADVQLYTDYCVVEENEAIPGLIIESVSGNSDILLCDEGRYYEELQAAGVDECDDRLEEEYREAKERQLKAESSDGQEEVEHEEEVEKWLSGGEDSVVVLDSDSEDDISDQEKKDDSETSDDDEIPKNVTIEELDSWNESKSEENEKAIICEEISSENIEIRKPEQNVIIEEVSEGYNNEESIVDKTKSNEEMAQNDGNQEIVKETQEEIVTIDSNIELKSCKDTSKSGVSVDNYKTKDEMDFEECISFNEISKHGQSQLKSCQISQAMDVDKDEAMDFEVEISASQISKPKTIGDTSKSGSSADTNTQTKNLSSPQMEGSETMEVEETVHAKTSKLIGGRENETETRLKCRDSRSRSGSVPPENSASKQNKMNRTSRGTSAPPEDKSDSNKRKVEELTVTEELVNVKNKMKSDEKMSRSEIKGKSVSRTDLQIIEEESHGEVNASFSTSSQIRAGSLPPDDLHRSKIRKSRRSSSLQPEDSNSRNRPVKPDDIFHEKRKIKKHENRVESVDPEDISMEKIKKKSKEIKYVSSKEVSSEESEKEIQRAPNKAVLIPTEDISVVDSNKKTQKAGSSTVLNSPEDIQDVYSQKSPYEIGNRTESFPADIPGSSFHETENVTNSVQLEDIFMVETKRKTESRAKSTPPENIAVLNSKKKSASLADETEFIPVMDSKKKSERRAGSVPPEYISVADSKKKTTSRVKSVISEDIPAADSKNKTESRDESVPPEDIPVMDSKKKIGSRSGSTPPDVSVVDSKKKAASRAGSVPPEDAPMVDSRKKTTSRAGSVPPEDVTMVDSKKENTIPSEDTQVVDSKKKIATRAGSIPPEDVPMVDSKKKNTSRARSVPPEDVTGVDSKKKTTIRAGSIPPEDTQVADSKKKIASRARSIPPEDVPVVDSEKKAASRARSIPPEDTPVVDSKKKSESRAGSITPEDIPVVDSKKKAASRAGSIPPEDVAVVDSNKKTTSRAGSIPPEDVPVVDSKKKTASRAGSIPPEDITVADSRKKTETRSGSIPPEDIPVADSKKKIASRADSISPEDITVADSRKKTGSRSGSIPPEGVSVVDSKKKTASRAGSISPENAPVMEEDDEEREEIEMSSSQASTICLADIPGVSNVHRPPSVSSQASTIKLRTGRSRRSSVSSQCSSVHEDMRLDIVYEEPENAECNRSGDFTSRVRRARSEAGSVHGAQTGHNKTSSDAGSVLDESFVRTLRSGKVISESEDDVGSPRLRGRRKVRADSTSCGDDVNSQQAMEEYATARRLTRHQRSLLERSLELAKSSQSSRPYPLPALHEASDDDEGETSSVGTRSSSRLSARHAPVPDNPSPTTSQASTIHILTSDVQVRRKIKTPRRSRRSLSRLNESVVESPGSVRSGASTAYASSVTSIASPTSTKSEDVIGSRTRRRSFKQTFKSTSEKAFPSWLPLMKFHGSTRGDVTKEINNHGISSMEAMTEEGHDIMASPTDSEVSSEASSGVLTRLAVVRLSKLKDDITSLASFQFSPPTAVPGANKNEEIVPSHTPLSPVPAFVFSPPQKHQPYVMPRKSPHQTRAHTMALRKLHTITEESLPTSPSTPSSSSQPQSSERDTTPIAVKRSKRFKSTPKASSVRLSVMTPLTEEEKRELAEEAERRRRKPVETRRYTAFKHRKMMPLYRSRNSKS
ncbi:hypothetical protein L9F63_014353, partial [Diploptera punctata]